MTDFKDIDDLFKSQQNDWNSDPANAVWNKLSDNLDNYSVQKKSNSRLKIRWGIAASVVVLLGLTFFFTTNPNLKNAQLAESSDQIITIPASHEAVADKENSRLDKRQFKSSQTKEINENAVHEFTTVEITASPQPNLEIKSKKSHSTTRDFKESQNKKTGTFGDGAISQNINGEIALAIEPNLEPRESSYDQVYESIPEFTNDIDEDAFAEKDLDNQIVQQDRITTVVSNSSGIAYQKAEHQEIKGNKDIGVGLAFADESVDDALEKSATLPSIAQVSEVNRAVAKEKHAKRSEGYSGKTDGVLSDKKRNVAALSNKIIYVYYPLLKNDLCDPIIKIENNNATLLDCHFTEIGKSFTINRTLNEFYNLTLNEMREIEFSEVYHDCLENYPLKIVVEYGMDAKRFQETVLWNLSCISSENKSYIKHIEKLIESNR